VDTLTRRRAIGIGVGVGLLAIALLAVLPVAVPPGSDGALDTTDRRPVGGIAAGSTAMQQFPAHGTAIRTVTVYLATFGRTNRGILHFSVFAETNGGWQRLATRDLDEATLIDNGYTTLTFSPPLPVMRGKGVRLVMDATGPPADAVTWWINPRWQQPGYQLTYNMDVVAGSAVFQVHYARTTYPLIAVFGVAWGRVTTFLTAPWQGLLILALIGMAGGVVLIFRPLSDKPDEEPSPTALHAPSHSPPL